MMSNFEICLTKEFSSFTGIRFGYSLFLSSQQGLS